MSDQFWMGLFGFLTAFVSAVAGLTAAYFSYKARQAGQKSYEKLNEKIDRNTDMTAEMKSVVVPEPWKPGDPERRNGS